MTHTLATRLVAWIVLAPSWTLAAALLVRGHHDAGDGFSAGLMAATGLVIHFVVLGARRTRRLAVVRHAFAIAGAGLLLVLVPALLPLLFGAPPFTHYPPPGSPAIALGVIELHSGFVLDTGVSAVVIGFVACTMDLLADTTTRLRGTSS